MADLNQEISPLQRARNWPACLSLLDAQEPQNAQDRADVAYWRAVVLGRMRHFREAVGVLDASRSDFACQSLVDLMRARFFEAAGDTKAAIGALKNAPLAQERSSFPGIVESATFFLCLFEARSGQKPAQALLDSIPDDFKTMGVEAKFLTKADIEKALHGRK